MGADPVTVINGLPVIPRFGLGHDIKSQILLSAYLGQPILPMGHHWDFQDGVTALINATESIRELGGTWADTSTIARGNFYWRVEGTTLRVRSYSRSFRLDVPEGIEILSVAFASLGESATELACRALPGGQLLDALAIEGSVTSFQVPSSGQVHVRAIPDGIGATEGAGVATPLHALLRRALAEARDRAMPWMPRVVRRGRS